MVHSTPSTGRDLKTHPRKTRPSGSKLGFIFLEADMSEKFVQNSARNALAGKCLNFRVNVGKAWTGSTFEKLPGRKILIHDARPFTTGLPTGFADSFGVTPVTITADMVGKTIGVFHAVEFKSDTGKATGQQDSFLAAIRRMGGYAGVARTDEEALAIALYGAAP